MGFLEVNEKTNAIVASMCIITSIECMRIMKTSDLILCTSMYIGLTGSGTAAVTSGGSRKNFHLVGRKSLPNMMITSTSATRKVIPCTNTIITKENEQRYLRNLGKSLRNPPNNARTRCMLFAMPNVLRSTMPKLAAVLQSLRELVCDIERK